LLRHEFADNNGQISDGADDKAVTDRLDQCRREAGVLQGGREIGTESGARKCASKDADQRYSDLDGRKEFSWVFSQI
jgi:hypothetical protein